MEGEELHETWDDDDPYEIRWWSYTSDLHPPTYGTASDLGTPSPASVNNGIASQAPWIPTSTESGNLVSGELKQMYLGTPAESRHVHWTELWTDPWGSITYSTWRAARKDKRMRIYRATAGSEPHKERYLKVEREGAMGSSGEIPFFGDMEVTDVDPVELTIPANQNYSGWVTVEAEAGSGVHRKVHLQPLDITVVCGIGPGGFHNGQGMYSKDLLEEYLEGIKIKKEGNIWAVNGKDASDNDRVYGIQIVTDEAGLLEALQADGRIVIYDGHANFGLGPNFSHATHKTIADFTNFGVNHTGVPMTFRGHPDGTENDVMPFWPGSLPEGASPQDAAAVQRITDEGWAYLTLQSAQIKGSVQNYTLPFIGGLRFPNADGIGSDQNFTKKGAGFNNEWHYNHEGSKKLMVSAPGEQVPQNLRYKTFFYNACSSGPHYVENFQHGEFVYTNRTCHVFWATLHSRQVKSQHAD